MREIQKYQKKVTKHWKSQKRSEMSEIFQKPQKIETLGKSWKEVRNV